MTASTPSAWKTAALIAGVLLAGACGKGSPRNKANPVNQMASNQDQFERKRICAQEGEKWMVKHERLEYPAQRPTYAYSDKLNTCLAANETETVTPGGRRTFFFIADIFTQQYLFLISVPSTDEAKLRQVRNTWEERLRYYVTDFPKDLPSHVGRPTEE